MTSSSFVILLRLSSDIVYAQLRGDWVARELGLSTDIEMPREIAWKSSKALSRLFLVPAFVLLGVHIVWILFLPQPALGSNLLQCLAPLLVVFTAIEQGRSNPHPTARRAWYALAGAFVIWETAQMLFVYFMFEPAILSPIRLDNVLWLVFGLPVLLLLTSSEGEADHVAWLDRAQTILFFFVLYLLVFVPAKRLDISKAYLIQNLALVSCCLVRLPNCETLSERRFFIRLAIFLLNYTLFESLGDLLGQHGWSIGSLADLVWTLPTVILIAMTSVDLRREEQEVQAAGFFRRKAKELQGANIALMTALSMVVSALLTLRSSVLGSILLAISFTIFAMRTNARERLWQQAHGRLNETLLLDPLTGLGNRLRLSTALRQQLLTLCPDQSTVLLFVDLDRFKQVNDTLGHAQGDKLLVEVGRRLNATASAGSTVCRIGGDEFVVLTAAVNSTAAQEAAEALLAALHAPFQLGAHQYRCSASVGVVIAGAEDDPDDLLRTSDHAMYRAKQKGRNRVQLFDAALRADLSTRRRMEIALRGAIKAEEVQVAFQPIYSVERGGICGFEALARWNDPIFGQVPPSEFITLAEESGLINQLGAQILQKACTQTAHWNRTWGTALSISVNVSPHQLSDPDLISSILKVVVQTGFTPNLLRLEITETALLLHDGSVKQILEKARAHGIHISLDDFGTGYSSLSFLLSLPVDEVKVDRSFVSHMCRDPDRKELVRTVVHLGHTLGKRVVAEGVETEQDLLDLTEMGCECVQGYLISKPFSAERIESELPALLARVHTKPNMSTDQRSEVVPVNGIMQPLLPSAV